MADKGPGALSDDVVEGLRNYSSQTTSPARAVDLFEVAAQGGCPVAHSEQGDGFFMLLDYDDVRGAMTNPAVFSSQPQVSRPLQPRDPIPGLEMDGAQHKAWRRIYEQALTRQTVEALEPIVRADVDVHIDGFIARGEADLVAELAETIPASTICRLVGVDEEMVTEVRDRAIAFIASFDGEPDEFLRRFQEFGDVALGEIRKREAEPRDDYLTYLTEVEVEGRALTDDDSLGLLASFLGAGHHSTTSAMASLIYEVFRRPDVRNQLIADPEAIPTAVEEALRLHPPFYGFFRRTTESVAVGGVEIPDGSDVYMGWVAANRDPDEFPEPTEFRMDRNRNRHLSFGVGVHACVGSRLARMELRVAIEQLLKRLPDIEIAVPEAEYVFAGGGDYTHIATLPVTFAPRDAAS